MLQELNSPDISKMKNRKPEFGFLLGIQKNELYASFIERIMEAASKEFVYKNGEILSVARQTLGFGWNLSKQIEPIAHIAPSASVIADEHGHLPLICTFLGSAAGTAMREKIINVNSLPFVRVKKPSSYSNFLLGPQLGVCPECAIEQMDSFGTVIWDREVAVRGNTICAKHGCAILRACNTCGKEFNLLDFGGRPRPKCPCGGRMIGAVNSNEESIGHALAQDVQEIFAGLLNEISSEGLLMILRESAREKGMLGRDKERICRDLVGDAGLLQYYSEYISPIGISMVLFDVMMGRKFSRVPMINVIGIRAMIGGPVREILKKIGDREDVRSNSLAFPDSVRVAAKNLMKAISAEYPDIYPDSFQSEFNKAYLSLQVYEDDFLADITREHKEKNSESRFDKQDDAILALLVERYESIRSQPDRITPAVLLNGIKGHKKFGKGVRDKFQKSHEFINEVKEMGSEGVVRRLIRLSVVYPHCVTKSTRDVIDYRHREMGRAALGAALQHFLARIRRSMINK